MTRKIFIFGNPDLKFDSLPLRILPELKNKLPKIDFEIKDPNEEWELEEFVIVDTIAGINKPAIFEGLENFSAPPRISVHDFDAYSNMKYLQKLGKIKKVKIIGLPMKISKKKAIEFVVKTLPNSL